MGKVLKDIPIVGSLLVPQELDTSAQDALAKAQEEELKLAQEKNEKAEDKAFAESESIKKGFRTRGKGLSLLGESENQLLG